jgi:hypothetical protein
MSLKLNSVSGGSVTLQEPVTASDFTITLPATTGTMALTTDGVTSLNGLTGALNGLTFISTTSITNGSTNTDVTGIPSGYKQIFFAFDYSMNTTNSSTTIGLRISTNNGSSFLATGYFDTDSNNVLQAQVQSTGTGTAVPRISKYGVIIQPTSISNTTPIIQFGGGSIDGGNFIRANNAFAYTSNNTSYVNAIQLIRVFGTRLFTGGSISLWGEK